MPSPRAALGIDLGSRTVKIVAIGDNKILFSEVHETRHDSLELIEERMKTVEHGRVVATGYGRHLLQLRFANGVVTEIRACALGAHYLCPDCRMVIDIGGQDFKVIEIGREGTFRNFELNDRCAAGSGRFLEVMAQILGYRIEEFGREALGSRDSVPISSMCTVFAESEVVSLLTSGKDRRAIALGLHHSIVDRIHPLIARLETAGKVMFAGGVARNECVVDLLGRKLGTGFIIPENPQIVSAIGAALIAARGL